MRQRVQTNNVTLSVVAHSQSEWAMQSNGPYPPNVQPAKNRYLQIIAASLIPEQGGHDLLRKALHAVFISVPAKITARQDAPQSGDAIQYH
jgi:malate synthase